MKLPSNIKIWGHSYKVKSMPDPHFLGESVLGLFKPNEQEIVLSRKHLAKRKSREAEVLLHEIIHGIYYNGDTFRLVDPKVDRSQLEEHITDSTANGLIAVFKDNPELLDYIKDRLKDEE